MNVLQLHAWIAKVKGMPIEKLDELTEYGDYPVVAVLNADDGPDAQLLNVVNARFDYFHGRFELIVEVP
jgi:hypothetical protein